MERWTVCARLPARNLPRTHRCDSEPVPRQHWHGRRAVHVLYIVHVNLCAAHVYPPAQAQYVLQDLLGHRVHQSDRNAYLGTGDDEGRVGRKRTHDGRRPEQDGSRVDHLQRHNGADWVHRCWYP